MESGTPPSAGFYDFLGWLDVNKKRVAIGAGVVLFIGIAVGFFVWQSSQKEIDAAEALSAIRMPFSPTEQPAPGTAEELVKVVEEYPKTAAAPKALLRAGTVYFDTGNFSKAQEQFERFLRTYGDTPWVPQAIYGIAASLDAQNKAREAITKYNDFVRSYGNEPLADQARLSLARLYDQTKEPALALESLNKIVSGAQAGGMSPAASEAQEKIRELYAKHPSLVPSNPAPVRPTAMPNMLTNFVRSTNITASTNALPNPSTDAPTILLNPNPGQPSPGK
jgi:predicted negative regulator of RcsB-dependent stress response